MKQSTDTTLRNLGVELELAVLARPPKVDYYVVRQPVGTGGAVLPLQAQKFDLDRGVGMPNPTTVPTGATLSAPIAPPS
jgi:hypothetical protein